MIKELDRWSVALHEAARLHHLRYARGELSAAVASAADRALAHEAILNFQARWAELQWLASDIATPPAALRDARSRLPPLNALGEEDVVGWVYQRLNDGADAGEIDVKRRRAVPRA